MSNKTSNIFKHKNIVSWEKTGNASWVECNNCNSWFNVGPSLINKPSVKLHCPNCHEEFLQNEAKKIIIA